MSNLETKSLSSLETSNSLNDGDKILIERDGDMVRIDSSAIGNNNIEIPVPDWNVNDSSTPGYIANRPFYVSGKDYKCVFENPELTFAYSDYDGIASCGLYYSSIYIPILEDMITIGSILRIVVDDEEYYLPIDEYEMYGQTYYYVGGNSGDDTRILETKVGFVYRVSGDEIFLYEMFITGQKGETHSVAVFVKDEAVEKLPDKYLSGKTIIEGTGKNAEIYNNIQNNVASGMYSHAEGNYTTASGYASHAEGNYATASNDYSHAEGSNATASGPSSHTEGTYTTASGSYSHAEGNYTTASGFASHAEGAVTTASGRSSHAEGENATASGYASHAEGGYSNSGGSWFVKLTGDANSTTYTVTEINFYDKSLLIGRKLQYNYSEATIIDVEWDNSGENILSITVDYSLYYKALTSATVRFKSFALASGESSHAEGTYTMASGSYSHAEGEKAFASGYASHAEGTSAKASGYASHAEGTGTKASNDYSHAEGEIAVASGYASHAEGTYTTASSKSSHAEGNYTTASGNYSHAEGSYTIAQRRSQHVFGEYNTSDENGDTTSYRGTYVEIVGNGSDNNNRSNARTLDWSGNETLAGSITIGKGTADEVTLTPAQLKQLLALLNN